MSSLDFFAYKMKVDGTSFAKPKAVIYACRAIDYLLRFHEFSTSSSTRNRLLQYFF